MRLGLSKSLEIPGERSVGLGPRPLWREYGLGSLDGGPCRTVTEYSEVESHRAGLKRTRRKTTELKPRAQWLWQKWDSSLERRRVIQLGLRTARIGELRGGLLPGCAGPFKGCSDAGLGL